MFKFPSSKQFKPSKSGTAIMRLVYGYFKKTKKPWAYIDQAWMMLRLEEWEDVKISRSTLNYNLRLLEDNGFLIRTSRHKTDPATGQFICRVTMYKITKKLHKWFYKIADFFKRIDWIPSMRQLKAGYLPNVGRTTTREEAVREVSRSRWRGAT